jgi:N-formylglutamate deformylase
MSSLKSQVWETQQTQVLGPLLITSLHSGELIPPEAYWLKDVSQKDLLRDVDRFVDQLLGLFAASHQVELISTQWLRQAVDLNRRSDDICARSVSGAGPSKPGFKPGVHWYSTSDQVPLIESPIPAQLHNVLIEKYYDPIHDRIRKQLDAARKIHDQVLHLDFHSMASVGKGLGVDGFEARAEIVVSDLEGKSSAPVILNLVVNSFQQHGLNVKVNWPYKGARILAHGRPELGQHSLQIEINRSLYMDELSCERLPKADLLSKTLELCLTQIHRSLKHGF